MRERECACVVCVRERERARERERERERGGEGVREGVRERESMNGALVWALPLGWGSNMCMRVCVRGVFVSVCV